MHFWFLGGELDASEGGALSFGVATTAARRASVVIMKEVSGEDRCNKHFSSEGKFSKRMVGLRCCLSVQESRDCLSGQRERFTITRDTGLSCNTSELTASRQFDNLPVTAMIKLSSSIGCNAIVAQSRLGQFCGEGIVLGKSSASCR